MADTSNSEALRSINGQIGSIRGIRTLQCAPSTRVATAQHAIDLIGAAMRAEAHLVIVPAAQLESSFFQPSSSTAADILQKFVEFQQPLIIAGDIAAHTETSTAFRSFVDDCNRGDHIWFVADLADLENRLLTRGAIPYEA